MRIEPGSAASPVGGAAFVSLETGLVEGILQNCRGLFYNAAPAASLYSEVHRTTPWRIVSTERRASITWSNEKRDISRSAARVDRSWLSGLLASAIDEARSVREIKIPNVRAWLSHGSAAGRR